MARKPGRGYGSDETTATPVVAIALLVLLLAACTPSAPQPPASMLSPLPASSATPGVLTLTIVHGNDTWGYLDPCG